MVGLLRAMARGAQLRCPACGVGRLLRGFEFQRECGRCGRLHLRDRGDWTGAAEAAMLVTFAIGVAAFLAAEAHGVPPSSAILFAGVVATVGLVLLDPGLRGAWIGLVYVWEGPVPRPVPTVSADDRDETWEHPSLYDR